MEAARLENVVADASAFGMVYANPGVDAGLAAADESARDAEFVAIAAYRRPLPPEILLDGPLELDAALAVAEGRSTLTIGDSANARLRAAHARLQQCVAEGRLVYGVTTGFGPLANRLVSSQDIETLQRNLIYHLGSGVGAALPWTVARATVLARLCSMARGWSGASETTVELLTALLNSPFAPRIPEKGTVGASGDLTPLAHVALALMGEGGFIDRRGRAVDPLTVFEALGRPPLTLDGRDGLALVNGVSAMTGVALVNGALATRLLRWSEALTAAHAELMGGRLEAWRAEFAEARPHPGQAAAAAALRARAEGSQRIDRRAAASRLAASEASEGGAAPALQDAYTLRCAPQILGAVRDTLDFHQKVLWRELNGASDNPIFGEGEEIALHGGNFMGSHIAFASDALLNPVIMVATLSERQIARLTDETRNGGLPAFLHRGPAGLNSGLMGAQVTATALLGEMRARGGAASAQSLPTNGDNQDVVSMGTIAARGCGAALEDLSRILAIQALAVAQGVDLAVDEQPVDDLFAGVDDGAAAERGGFSRSTAELVRWVRARSAPIERDRPLSEDIETLASELSKKAPPIGRH